MRRAKRHSTTLAIALSALLVSVFALAKEPSHVVFPDQKIPLKFSHKQHLAKQKIECDFCHEGAPGSLSAADSLMPKEDSCESCHKIDRDQPEKQAKPAARCDSCHVYNAGAPPMEPLRIDVPAPNLKFNHKVHVDREIKCERCHGTMKDVELATRSDLPLMPSCLTCHNNIPGQKKGEAKPEAKVDNKSTRAPARCATCHIQQADSTLQTQFDSGRLVPSGTLKGDAHTADFATHHTQVGRDEAQYCESCHRKDFCLACHNGVVKPLSFHGNDYISIHPIEARKATTNCDGCHRRQTFCLGCHERSGLTQPINNVDSPINSLHNTSPPRRFHPVNWTFDSMGRTAARTPDHHSWQAERNLKQCVSCHREESCLQCHASSGVKTQGLPSPLFHVNPHPPGFAGSRQCDAISSRNGRVCLKCHALDDPHLSCR